MKKASENSLIWDMHLRCWWDLQGRYTTGSSVLSLENDRRVWAARIYLGGSGIKEESGGSEKRAWPIPG